MNDLLDKLNKIPYYFQLEYRAPYFSSSIPTRKSICQIVYILEKYKCHTILEIGSCTGFWGVLLTSIVKHLFETGERPSIFSRKEKCES